MTHVQHWLAWSRHASLLPEPVTPFVGREKEQSELTKWLDLHSDEVRIINIVGPTGIGKSALAIQLGHQLIDRGAIVSYVDTSIIFLEGISSEILRSTGSTSSSKSDNSSVRLTNWLRREMKDPLVIILDNCDRYIIASELATLFRFFDVIYSNAATIVKIIITSRKTVKPAEHHSESFIEYPIGQIYPDASCQLLCAVSKREMSAGVCESITELTGNIPLSLTLIGTILESTPVEISKVVSFLEKETKLVSNHSPSEEKLDASISVALIYLRNKLTNLGKYLSLFPASFSLTNACSVLHSLANDDCAWIDKLHQRNLLFLSEETHYHFRDVVREHFMKLQGKSKVNEAEFWRQYMQHFTALLHKQCLEFQNHPNYALELEKQEMRHFIRNSIDRCGKFHSQCCQLLQILKVSIGTQFIFSIYGNENLAELLQNILTTIELVFKDNTLSYPDTDDLYIYFTLILVDLNSSRAELVFEQARHWMDDHSDSANSTLVEQFYFKLSTHYLSKGGVKDEIYCHLQILKRLRTSIDCNPSTCTHSEISDVYYNLGRYELSGYFQGLHIENSNLSTLQLMGALLRLHTCQMGNLSEARDTAKKILDLSIDTETMNVHNKLELYLNISNIFRQHEWREEAKRVEQKIITTAMKRSYFKSAENKEIRQILFSLIDTLVKAKEHSRIPEVVLCALDTYEDENYNSREVAALYLVLGKAELYNQRRRASINNLKVVMQWYYKDTTLFNYARDACNAMLIQTHIEFTCFTIALEETWILIHSIWEFILSDTFDPKQFSISHIFDSPTNILLADRVEDIPVVHYCIVFFFKWCLAYVRYLFSYRFLVILVNLAFILFKFACVISAPIFSFFLIYAIFSYVKRVYRMLWDPVWSGVYYNSSFFK